MSNSIVVRPPGFLADPTRFLFFTGKGGVGKTSIACATALSLADGGKSVLLVSTDPTSPAFDGCVAGLASALFAADNPQN